MTTTLQLHKITFRLLAITMPLLLIACAKNSSDDDTDAKQISEPRLYLNDTGLGDYTQVFSTRDVDSELPVALSATPDTTAPEQDADLGKDNESNASDLDGKRGFKYTRLDNQGNTFAVQPSDYSLEPWNCVRDENTGLIWEVKTIAGLQRNQNTYTWYNTDEKTNGGHAGTINDSTSCADTLSYCNTEEYINAINALNNGKGLCGLKNWRLPLREELRSIVDYSVTDGPMIDTLFFPNAMDGDTWTSQTAYYGTTDGKQAWEVHFNMGYSEAHEKSSGSVYVRLVHDSVN